MFNILRNPRLFSTAGFYGKPCSRWNLPRLLAGVQSDAAASGNSRQFLEPLNMVTVRPGNSTPRLRKRNEKSMSTKTYTQVFMAALFITAKSGKNPHNRLVFGIKRTEIQVQKR